MDYLKEFTSKLHNLDRSKNIATVFKDFLTLCTCSLAQPVYRSSEIEQIYLDTVKNYTKGQAEDFSKLLAFLVSALEEKFQDFLGLAYMNLNIGSSVNGQFFTPYHISKFMAEITFTDSCNYCQNQEIITLSEPCCGAGGMVIAFAETLKEHNINYQKNLYVEATDIDKMCFMMTYIQLALYGIPAKVILGDTITLKFQKVLYTPFYFVNGFHWKLKCLKEKSEFESVKTQLIKQIEPIQLNLF